MSIQFYMRVLYRGSAPDLGTQTLPGKNFISGCCAVGSAPALGAGGPGFESPHSDQLALTKKMQTKNPHLCADFLHHFPTP